MGFPLNGRAVRRHGRITQKAKKNGGRESVPELHGATYRDGSYPSQYVMLHLGRQMIFIKI
ncbi:MAG: hypothetical protein JJ935_05340 [Muricauda sp.]|nr:hypothetical protein [Allomuricauda sp.]MBO6533655.1 hypothetical protein [Allomuricauda sp.]MBO6588523.1 hypothetical protein [Allomuricauda sp.]MBO6618337.1 hypothetical protein [Allomuricauda sp.]MBO6644061.1 hypothetical protein [Allomuricauda sp.]MBO6746945.1 hypothetical protein [Allomuricauda sp.]